MDPQVRPAESAVVARGPRPSASVHPDPDAIASARTDNGAQRHHQGVDRFTTV